MNKSEEYKDIVIELYNKGISITKISISLGISQPTVSKILKTNNIPIRKDNYQKLAIDEVEVNNLYSQGLSTYDIAKKLNCSDESIRKLIRQVRPINIRNQRSGESIEKIKQASERNWRDGEYVKKVQAAVQTPEYKAKLSDAAIKNYDICLGKWIKTIEAKSVVSKQAKAQWQDPAYRSKQLAFLSTRMPDLWEASKKALQDPEKRAQWLKKLRANSVDRLIKQGWVSHPQKQLYYLLSSSGIEYYEEGKDTKIGPFYVVDCVIPVQQQMKKPLIIEVQGEYWHSLPRVQLKDRQKETYIRKHTEYDLIKLEELHLASFDEVYNVLSGFGLHIASQECKVKDLEIKQIDESQASMFYSIFHYTGTVRRGATVYGAFYNNELMAAISYCYPIRQEVSSRLGHKHREVLEISRLARKTNFKCKNLISFLISKSSKLLPSDVKCLVSYSDAAYNHTGTAYKASGFILDGIVAPDYYYVSINGKYHKKTIWDRSKKMKMTESDYADKHNLVKIMGKEKTRWIMRR